MMRLILLFSFVVSSYAFADSFQCNDQFKSQYVKGDVNGAPSDKLFKFKAMRDDVLTSLDNADTDKIDCLTNFYQDAMKQSGEYWGKRQSEASCTDECQKEFEKSSAYLNNLDKEFKGKVTKKIAAIKNAGKQDACGSKSDNTKDIGNVRDQMCCGTADQPGTGAVRGIYPDINYLSCLSKTRETDQEMMSASGLTECVGNIIASALKSIWNNIKSLVSLPAELWAARDQIYQLMTNSDARAAFADHMIDSIKKFVSDRSQSLSSCLNSYEESQYICKTTGDVIGFLATPAAIGKLFKLAKAGIGAGGAIITDALGNSRSGQKILDGLEKAKGNAAKFTDPLVKAKQFVSDVASVGAAKMAAAMTKLTAFSVKESAFGKALKTALDKYGKRAKPNATVSGQSPDPSAAANAASNGAAAGDAPSVGAGAGAGDSAGTNANNGTTNTSGNANGSANANSGGNDSSSSSSSKWWSFKKAKAKPRVEPTADPTAGPVAGKGPDIGATPDPVAPKGPAATDPNAANLNARNAMKPADLQKADDWAAYSKQVKDSGQKTLTKDDVRAMLNLPADATDADMKNAINSELKRYYPDRNPDYSAQSTEATKALIEMNDVLKASRIAEADAQAAEDAANVAKQPPADPAPAAPAAPTPDVAPNVSPVADQPAAPSNSGPKALTSRSNVPDVATTTATDAATNNGGSGSLAVPTKDLTATTAKTTAGPSVATPSTAAPTPAPTPAPKKSLYSKKDKQLMAAAAVARTNPQPSDYTQADYWQRYSAKLKSAGQKNFTVGDVRTMLNLPSDATNAQIQTAINEALQRFSNDSNPAHSVDSKRASEMLNEMSNVIKPESTSEDWQ